MAKPELGLKRTCVDCNARFYDLNRVPAVCPKCGTTQPTNLSRLKKEEELADEKDKNLAQEDHEDDVDIDTGDDDDVISDDDDLDDDDDISKDIEVSTDKDDRDDS
ncbi:MULTISPECIES: FYDLN acid domain-containing protein [Bombella]|uniref:FYDLN acid domain-containing protein n=2 Tax=Bombella TaxID=1654741 RepID=A0ABT3WMC0_9PROT|nr:MULTISPECIES: FYDLN acid domain-containing protein [Bombella]MBA5727332.1 TIGR02300 family protein [Bombella mellum]MCX5617966.1 FYDLN acid domain-containing protein [Bombella pluederhausensis]